MEEEEVDEEDGEDIDLPEDNDQSDFIPQVVQQAIEPIAVQEQCMDDRQRPAP